jgi:hypothetical protein
MSELISTAVDIKDPFTLFAFLAVILLVAFKTKTVPESVFKLLGDKITRERFYRLLNRSLAYGFVVFLVLCGVAVVGQVLDYLTTAKAASIDQLKTELTLRHSDDEAAQRALEAYEKGLALAQTDKLSEAIASLESSLKAVPTSAARETLALLYQRLGNTEGASKLAEQALAEARTSGHALNTARAERFVRQVGSSRPPSELAGERSSATEGFGVGTVTITNLKTRSAEVYSQDSQGRATWDEGYAGTLSPEAPSLQLPAGTYKLKFDKYFLPSVAITSGRNTPVTLGALSIDNLQRSVEVYSQDSQGRATWDEGYAGTLSIESPAVQLPPGVYKLKFANHFVERVRVESGNATRLK